MTLSALLCLSLHGVPGGLHGLLGIRLLTLEILLPQRLSDLELTQTELLIRNRSGYLQLVEHQWHPILPPGWLLLVPLVVVRLIGWDLAWVSRWTARYGVLPDTVVEGQRLHVFGGFFFVLPVFEQARARGPENGRTLAAGRL